MLSHTRAHHSSHRLHWDPASVAITILVTLLFLLFLFMFLTLTATPALGQNHVPPTAAQAAKMPQFASRLAHPTRMGRPDHASRLPAQQRATYRNPSDPRARRGRIDPLDSFDIYDNGPINGTVDAWTINSGFVVSNTFTLQGQGTPNGMNFAAWLFPGDVLESAELSITSSEFGGTTYFDGVVNFTTSNCITNQLGFLICVESGTFPDVQLNAGTYWVNLQNAVVNNGDPVYWDENSGPSQASQNSVGTIPSESFTILGGSSTTYTYGDNYACPPPEEGLHDLHDIPEDAASSGLAGDAAGNLYGSMAGGANGQGMLYRLAQRATHWFFSSLYSFLGGDDGGNPGNVLLGPDGNLYGSLTGGVQNCGTDDTSYCGLIFKANPKAIPCPSASCSWNETPIFQFTGNNDAWGGIPTAFDSVGNLYGISVSGGTYGQGAIFKLTPSSGSWSETILYSFQGLNDGFGPNSLLVGRDGYLYGTASGGEYGWGVVFRLFLSGGEWRESVLYAFTNNGPNDGYAPGGLVQDRSGNLYGYSVCTNRYEIGLDCDGGFDFDSYGLVFRLSPEPSSNKWNFTVFYNNVRDCQGNRNLIHALALDENRGLYAAQGAADFYCGFDGCYTYYCGQITSVGGGALVSGNADVFPNLTVGANGHLYGTTKTCGGMGTPFRTKGMIWEYSP